MQAQIDPRPASKPLSGEFSLAGLDLSLARPFVPMVEKLQGRLNGSGRLSGGPLAPRVDGRVTLSDGNIGGGELPTSFENLPSTLASLAKAWNSAAAGAAAGTARAACPAT